MICRRLGHILDHVSSKIDNLLNAVNIRRIGAGVAMKGTKPINETKPVKLSIPYMT